MLMTSSQIFKIMDIPILEYIATWLSRPSGINYPVTRPYSLEKWTYIMFVFQVMERLTFNFLVQWLK